MPHRNRMARLVAMLRLLLSEAGWSGGALAKHFGVSRTRIYTDIAALRQGGVPVKGTSKGYRIDPSFLVAEGRLTRDEMLALLFPAELFDGGEQSARAAQTARAKLMACLTPGQRVRLDILEALREAVRQRRRVRVEYRLGSRRKRTEVDPYALALGSRGWSVVGCPAGLRDVRRFRLAHIVSVKPTRLRFDAPESLPLAGHAAKGVYVLVCRGTSR